MKADGLQECDYKYRDIRKGIVYLSAFLWENMEQTNPEEYKTHVTDKCISDLIKQCDKEQLNRKSVDEAVQLYQTGKHSFDEIYAMTNVKMWQVYRALHRE